MGGRTTSGDALPLTPAEVHILLALADRDRHGYAIIQEVAEASGGRMRLGSATLYRSIKQLLDRGWIAESQRPADAERDDQRRRYYRLTPQGRQVVTAEVDRLRALVRTARARGIVPQPASGTRLAGEASP